MRFKVNEIGELKSQQFHAIVKIISYKNYTYPKDGQVITELHYMVLCIKNYRNSGRFTFDSGLETAFRKQSFEENFRMFKNSELIYA